MRALLFALLALTVPALAADSAAPHPAAGVVTSVSGLVAVYPADAAQSHELKLASAVHAGDRIKTGANGRAVVVLNDGTRLNVSYNTDITLRDRTVAGKASARGIASIKIALGELWAKVTKKDSQLEFETPSAVAAVKGTQPGFVVGAGPDPSVCFYLIEGALKLSNADGSADMGKLTQVCLGNGIKLSQGLVKPWDGKTGKPDDLNGTASGAEVKIQIQGADGQPKTLDLHYGK
jgi:hypothetical protein